MSILYHLVAKINAQDPSAPAKYYAQADTRRRLTTKDLAEAITSKTTLSETDVIAALMAIHHEVEIGLQEGKSIDLLDLCIIYPTLQSKGVDAPGDFRARKHIVRAGVRIRPKKSLIARLANCRFVRRK
jgi:predicted histone-like DNA-binding protein